MAKLLKAQLHQRPTYEMLVKDSILEPKDKIALPDRDAAFLKRLSNYHDTTMLNS